MPAAVLLILYPRPEGFHVLFQKRTEEVEHHKGEISLPGGGRDPEDTSLLATAIRESFEEMGILPEHVTLIGELDDISTRTRFSISPYVATIPYPYTFTLNAAECAEVLEVPLSGLLDSRNVLPDTRGGYAPGRNMRMYAHQHHLIYGATARIVDQFLDFVRKAQRLETSPTTTGGTP